MNEKKFVIFEGITSAGKTTLVKKLKSELEKSHSVYMIPQHKTLVPILENESPELAVDFLKDHLKKAEEKGTDFTIADRFHYTHAFRTDSSVEDFIEIEDYLEYRFDPKAVFLRINQEVVRERIKETKRIRGNDPREEYAGGIKFGAQIQYFKEQQSQLLQIAQESSLPILSLNTTEKEWSEYLKDIKEFVLS